ncbi:MAG: elongation factor P hydroxylase [Deltaproteobacteria bacterium]|jgi:elongation factor P hydroxylase|nr:elongation factor P hydroxylase [Deltaproteobacteria bacterium]
MTQDARDLEHLFAACFRESHLTELVGGGTEPLYLPSEDPARRPHRILYREDFFASALHEVAHWCIAGPQRRRLEDFGYWYAPDGRAASEQAAFEAVEARPQALESIFSEACGFEFHLSADNLASGTGPGERFAAAVEVERRRYLDRGLPLRAGIFRQALVALKGRPPRRVLRPEAHRAADRPA